MTRRLLIDTHSEYCLLGVTDKNQMLAEEIFLHSNQLNHTLLPKLKVLLEKAACPLETIEEINAGIGPGSYTGTRVGVSVARSLHFGLKMRGISLTLRGFYSLLSRLPLEAKGTFICTMPTKTGSFYALEGYTDSQSLKCSFSGFIDEAAYALRRTHASVIINSSIPMCPPSLQPILRFLNQCPLATEPLTELIYLYPL